MKAGLQQLSGAAGLLSRCTLTGGSHRTIDPLCLENPCPAGAEPTLTENVASPFQAEPRQFQRQRGDPDDVFFQARERKQEIKEKIKALQDGLARQHPRQDRKTQQAKKRKRTRQKQAA